MNNKWPGTKWLCSLYAHDHNSPDILLIGIDDDQGLSFTDLIKGIYRKFADNNPTLSMWILHLSAATFEEWKKAAENFNDFLDKTIPQLVEEHIDDMPENIIKDFNQYKDKLKEAQIKIWVVDLKDRYGEMDNSVEILNILKTKVQKYVIFSQHGQQLDDNALSEHEDNVKVSKIRKPDEASYESLYNKIIHQFLPKERLENIGPEEWHMMRFSGNRKVNDINDEKFQNLNHWLGGGSSPLIKYAEDAWNILDRIQIGLNENQQSLSAFFNRYGYARNCGNEFTSSSLNHPSIRALLQIYYPPYDCNDTKKEIKILSSYLDLVEQELKKISYVKEVCCKINAHEYLWFNVVALYHALDNIVKSYSEYCKGNGQIKIKIMEEADSGISVTIKEENIEANPRWPYSSKSTDKNKMNQGAKDLLGYIKRQGVKNVFYCAMHEKNFIYRKVTFNDGNKIVTDGNWGVTDERAECNDEYTFFWMIDADEKQEDPYVNMHRQAIWSCVPKELTR